VKLFFAPLSPFVRKVRVAAHELGMAGRVELVEVATTPVAMNEQLASVNPLGKLPALVTDDGELLYDSPVILEYLDAVYPREGKARWAVKRLEALCDGMADAAILMRYETFLRPPERQWDSWIAGQKRKVVQALDALEIAARKFDGGIDAGRIAAGCHLAYIDLRFADMAWRKGRETLARWHETFAGRPSMSASKPPAS
jgi:glutathione S-transferase